MLKIVSPAMELPTGGEIANDADEHYVVERIMDHQYDAKTKDYRYLVKWKGYGAKDNTWERAANFDDINIITKYWKNIGKKLPKSVAKAKAKKKAKT